MRLSRAIRQLKRRKISSLLRKDLGARGNSKHKVRRRIPEISSIISVLILRWLDLELVVDTNLNHKDLAKVVLHRVLLIRPDTKQTTTQQMIRVGQLNQDKINSCQVCSNIRINLEISNMKKLYSEIRRLS